MNYPWESRLSELFAPLQQIDEKALADACTHKLPPAKSLTRSSGALPRS